MTIYYIIVILALCGCLIKQKQIQVSYCILLMLLMMCISGLRDKTVGPDTIMYIRAYSYTSVSKTWITEYMFNSVMVMLKSLQFTPYAIQFVFSAITFIPLIILFAKKSRCMALSILIYITAQNIYFFETMNIVRQSCSIPYIIWAMYAFIDKKYIKTIIFYFIALGFHASAIFSIPILLLGTYIYAKPQTEYILLFTTAIIGLSLTKVSAVADYYTLLEDLPFANFDKYSLYSEFQTDNSKNFNGLIMIILPSTTYAYYCIKYQLKNPLARTYIYGVMANNILISTPTGFRVFFSVLFLETLLIPSIIYPYKNSNKINKVVVFMVLFSVVFELFKRLPSIPDHGNWFVPYTSII